MKTFQTLGRFIKKHGITAKKRWDNVERWFDDYSSDERYRYLIRIFYAGRTMTVPYRMGSGMDGNPKLKDVLDCLASDAAGYENAKSFEDWCGEYGFNTDSRKDYRTYKDVERQTKNLEDLLRGIYKELLWETGRG